MPLITADSQSPLIKYVPPPELHLLIGITTHIFKSFQNEFGQLAEDWLGKTSIQMSHRSQFNGNGARLLLKKIEVLKELDSGNFT